LSSLLPFFTPNHLGECQFYLMTVKDKDGLNFEEQELSPHRTRPRHPRPHPRHAPGRPGLAKPKPAKFCGPKAPAGKDSNWVPTNPSRQFEVLFRFFGPEKPLFDKTWKLPDIERIAAQ
jgi:hypothetical protein